MEATISQIERRRVLADSYLDRIIAGETCEEIARADGVCRLTVRRVLLYFGYPTKLPKIAKVPLISPRDRKLFRVLATLNKFIEKAGVDECWNWTGSLLESADCDHIKYGKVRAFDPLDADDTRLTTAHRVVYMLNRGPIPEDMVIDHICFNTLCCNPAHLQLLTRAENSARKDPRRLSSKGDQDQLAG